MEKDLTPEELEIHKKIFYQNYEKKKKQTKNKNEIKKN